MVLESSLYKSENTLLETVCKCILDEAGETYGDDDLPKLYKMPAKVLILSIPCIPNSLSSQSLVEPKA
jgi:hypothetical protein